MTVARLDLAFFGLPGWAEFAVAAILVLLLFSPLLPRLARRLGQGLVGFSGGFRRGLGRSEDDE